MNELIGYNIEEDNITKPISRSSITPEKISREAMVLIKLGEAVGQLGESEELLREARHQCHKLRRERLAITRAYDDVCQQLDEARETIRRLTLEIKEEH